MAALAIICDVHERASDMPMRLCDLGAHVKIARLAAGDYDVGGGCLVERKQVLDLHDSLLKGRLWPQIRKLRQGAPSSYLLVEGWGLDGPIGRNALQGVLLAVSDLGIVLLRSVDRDDSAAWLYRLASRRQRPHDRVRPAYAQRPQSPPDAVAEAMLAAVPGVSHVTAKALLRQFGSVAAIAAADEAAMLAVPGVGPTRAHALYEAFRTTQPN